MKTIANCLVVASLALVGSSCQHNKQANNTNSSGYEEYGYYPSDSSSPESTNSNPYATDSAYGSYQQSASRDNDYVNVTPAPQNSGGSTHMPAHQESINPLPSQAPAPSYGDTSGSSVATANSHTVSHGDNLYRISKMYGSTVEGIKSANGLNSNLIHPGDILHIP